MVQTEIAPAKSVFDVKRGDIWQLGKHRLMCGDAQSTTDVATLFDGAKADLVVTSPPYADCREYTAKIPCWDTLMLNVFNAVPCHKHTQLLVNLGVIHRKNEWMPYWWDWLQAMRQSGWRHYSLYVWDKRQGVPGFFSGRLRPAYEFVFHLNKKTVNSNKWHKCEHQRQSMSNLRKKDGTPKRERNTQVGEFKVPDNVIRQSPVRFGESVNHPAQYPEKLAAFLMLSWGSEKSVIYDPFCGSGTTLIAAAQTGRIGYGMEVAPKYVEMALKRWLKLHPDQMPALIERTV